MVSHKGHQSTWMREHLSDPFVKKANAEGWRSRAVYKLGEIDKKDRLIKPGMRVVDLGAAPGSWSQYATRKLNGKGQIVALDILPMDPLPDVAFIQGDFTEDEPFQKLLNILGNDKCDLVMSDMAPTISGIKAIDQPRSIYLVELALDLASQVLYQQGTFLAKVFQGEGFNKLLRNMRQQFSVVVSRKPAASRAKSREIYLVGRGISEGR